MRVIIAGGGTGGHLFPALALAQELRGGYGADVLLVGAGSGTEGAILTQACPELLRRTSPEPLRGSSFPVVTIRVKGLKGVGLGGKVHALAMLPLALRDSRAILKAFWPQVVVGMGGYASGPILLAAALRRLPTLIHEQNAYPGLANRLLAPFVDLVALSTASAAPYLKARRIEVVGLPIREELLKADRAEAREALGLSSGRLTVFIFGGSQGAHRINEALVEALPYLRGLGEKLQFLHATGERDHPMVKQAYEEAGLSALVRPFFREVSLAYALADLCICRAGASTIAELAALGKPSLLIPYPYAANDHQRLNALALVRIGGARMLLDRELSGGKIVAFLAEVLAKPSLLEEMGRRTKELGRPDAASRLASLVLELVNGKKQFKVQSCSLNLEP